jgi:hypothetical protein
MKSKDLLKLVSHLRALPKRRGFYQGFWVIGCYNDVYAPNMNTSHLRKAAKNEYKCGMAACVGGHAALVFPRRLRIRDGMLKTTDALYGGSKAFAHAFDLCTYCAEVITDGSARHRTAAAAAMALEGLVKGRLYGRKVDPRSCHFGVDDCTLHTWMIR